jgi:hypothetical protein
MANPKLSRAGGVGSGGRWSGGIAWTEERNS